MYDSNLKFGFVILHYKTYEMTKLCVNQVLNLYNNYQIHIVIVDNASENGSAEKLINYFKSNKNVSVIINSDNIGFAKGNNVGYSYLKKMGYTDFIIIMNNDILVTHPDDLSTLVNIYRDTKFDVLGPDIYALNDNIHQNPQRSHLYTEKDIRILLSIYRMKCLFPLIFYVHEITKRNKSNQNLLHEMPDEFILHGAYYAFSERFILNRENAFNPDTFLYGEEDLLCMECIANGYKMVYSPEICVMHLEHFSTKHAVTSAYKRYKTKNKHMLQSYKIIFNNYKRLFKHTPKQNWRNYKGE